MGNNLINTKPLRIDYGSNMNERNPHLYPKPISPGYYWARWATDEEDQSWVPVELFRNSVTGEREVYETSGAPFKAKLWEFGARLVPPPEPLGRSD